MPTDALHIASLLVHVQPSRAPGLARWLEGQPDTEIRAEDAAGKLVVVLESQHERRILELVDRLQARPGVLGAALVYHQVLDPATADDAEETAEPPQRHSEGALS
ncbi:chaperone NapD [Halomonas campisalis]|uniref:Chaperone NapD n=1 Tax=Billgrantia campisalis TaxID=74661 RepID=A0ABS9P684_9GAMM|nr:chaperone NapD [Halomonas campisalis]MCG6657288.1 chaperone NapD [Halomonas campisalis]MDR5864170.1 chaperone NapD [Halomonas campisalis]